MNYQDYKLKNFFNLKLIGIGFIFLADYNLGVIDILPDWIGLILIFFGIGKLAYINSNFGSAVRYIKMWFAVAVIKSILTAVELVFSVFNDSDTLMLVTGLGLFELIFAYIVFGNIVAGCDLLLNIDNQFENAKKLAYISPVLKSFFILKFILVTLVQLPLLLSENTYDYLSIKYNMYFTLELTKSILTPPCFIISTLLALFAVSLVIPFFNSISRSKNLYEIIKDRVNHLFLNDKVFILKKSYNSAFNFFAVGTVFLIDFEFDRINLLPDFIIYICLLLGLNMLSVFAKQANQSNQSNDKDNKNDKRLNIYAAIGLFASLAAYVFTTAYRSEVLELANALDTIFILRIFATVFYILSVALFFITAFRFLENIKKIQGYHLNFSQIYLDKYISQAESRTDINKKQKNRLLILLGAISAAKILSFVFGDIDSLDIGMYKFFVSVILLTFVILTIRYLYKIKNDIYSYYN